MINTILSTTHNAKSNDKFAVLEGLIKKHYSPITNKNKLANGCYPFQAVVYDLNRAVYYFSKEEYELYKLYIEWIRKNAKNLDDKTGVFFMVRKDIPAVQQAIQLAHCAAVMAQANPKTDMNHCNFIVFGVGSEGSLKSRWNMNGYSFYEPDNNMGYSAFATPPIRYSKARRMRNLQGLELLKL
jgi:hypothetical protein